MTARENRLLELTSARLKSFETATFERLSRVEENLRLLRQDLIGDGQPGRIARIETDVSHLRAEYHRQRGLLAGISFVVSAAVAWLTRWLSK